MQTHWHALSLSLRRPTNTERNEERIRADTASGASLWKKRKANKIHVNTPTEMNEEWGMRRAVSDYGKGARGMGVGTSMTGRGPPDK